MTYTYEQALQDSIEYFNNDELAAKVFLDKYALRDGKGNILENTPTMMHHRLAREFARIEKSKFKTPLSEEEIFGYFDKFKYIIPQGSPMAGIGNNYQITSISNCYLLDVPADSYSSILQVDEQLVNISKRRGGVGIDLSNLRPTGTPTRNAARSSTGITTWMERYSNSIREVGQGGRRGALMLTLDCHHPDIIDFCTIKNDKTKVTGANISVRLTKEFLDAVKNDTDYELRFPVDYKQTNTKPLVSKTISAKTIWNIIVDNAHKSAEPGLIMWDNITQNTPADCYEEYKSRGTNPCSEINLSPLDSCRLLCQNLFSYVVNPFTDEAYFDYDLFFEHAKIAQRLMDDMVDLESEKINTIINKVESDPEPDHIKASEIGLWKKIQKFNDEGRRTGTGITALGDTLAALNIKYGTNDSIKATGEIYKTLKLGCYTSSVDMAEELGAFKCFDWEKEKNNPFILQIKEDDIELYNRMGRSGRRNISLLTTAPTGSVSIEAQTSSGIEPLFMLFPYTRRKKINPNDNNVRVDFVDQNGDSWQEFEVYHPKVKLWMEVTGESDLTKSPWYGACAEDIDWINRVKLQAAAQKHVCHAISSTINLPEDVSKETVAQIYQTAFESGLKGITIYRKNCRTGVLVDKKEETPVAKSLTFRKRSSELKTDVYHVKVKGEPYFVFVGLDDEGRPHELFAGKNGVVPNSLEEGYIKKIKRGHYQLLDNDREVILDNITAFLTDDGEALTRMVSMCLRAKTEISYIVDQLGKVEGGLTILSKAISRSLKKYIKDGTKVSGEACDDCGKETLVRQSGCVTCASCGWSKC